jgi:alpha-L-rhamnosidase
MLATTTTMAMAAGSLTVDNLRCEYKTDPIGLDVAQPRLSWTLAPVIASQRGLTQDAYQILVASSSAALDAGQGDLWDSGKVASSQSVHVPYAGKELVSAQGCFWKVRVWDQDGQESPWSAVGRWGCSGPRIGKLAGSASRAIRTRRTRQRNCCAAC